MPSLCCHYVVIFPAFGYGHCSTVHRAYRDAAPMLEAVWAGHATPILHPFHALLRSAKKNGRYFDKNPQKV